MLKEPKRRAEPVVSRSFTVAQTVGLLNSLGHDLARKEEETVESLKKVDTSRLDVPEKERAALKASTDAAISYHSHIATRLRTPVEPRQIHTLIGTGRDFIFDDE